MESSTVCIALLLVLVAGLSTVWGAEKNCNEQKMAKCVQAQSVKSTDSSIKNMCKKMDDFLKCYEKNGKGCAEDKKKNMKSVVDDYKKQMKTKKCEDKLKQDDKKKDDGKKNGASNLQVSSLILSVSALLFVPAIYRV